MLTSVILNLSVSISTISTTRRIPESSLLYASWSLGKPGVVREASIIYLTWTFPSIIIAAVTHHYFKDPSFTAIASYFLMMSSICLSISSIDLYPRFQVLMWEVYFLSTVRPIPVHLMCPYLSVSTFFIMARDGGSIMILLLILTNRLWLSLPCRLRTDF